MGVLDRVMRRDRRLVATTSDARAVTAAGRRVDLSPDVEQTPRGTRRKQARSAAWQQDAWVYRDSVGEVRYALDWEAAIMSRLRLIVGVIVDPTDAPVPLLDAITPPIGADGKPTGEPALVTDLPEQLVQDALDALNMLGGGAVGHGHLLSPLTVNMECPGECYLLGVFDSDSGVEEWSIRSTSELQQGADGVWVLYDEPGAGATTGVRLDPENSYVARLWKPHPQWHELPDSPMRGILGACEGLLLAERKGRVRDRRQLNNGLLFVPDEIEFEREPGQPATPFMHRLVQMLVSAVTDESSAASLSPGVIRGKGDAYDKIKWLTFTDNEAEARELDKVTRYLDRIAKGLDVPPEVISGLKDVKFANAVAIDSTGFRYHIEPKAQSYVDAFTQGYLWERLLALGHPEDLVLRLVVWYDPTEVVTNPNRLPDALQLHERMAIADRVLRDAGGYGEGDAPDEDELLRRMAVTSGMPEQMVSALLAIMGQQAGVTLPTQPTGDGGDTVDGEVEDDTAPAALPSGETQRPDEIAASAAPAGKRPAPYSSLTLALDLDLRARVTAAADAALRRALERAGARVVSKARNNAELRARIAGVPQIAVTAAVGEQGLDELSIDADALLAGAFDELGETYRLWATATFEQALSAACGLLGLTYYPPTGDRPSDAVTAAAPPVFSDDDTAPLRGLDQLALRNRFARDLAESADGLVADLTADARRRLFDPVFRAPEFGEHDPSLLVRPGTVRRALATAGGATSGTAAGVDSNGRTLNPDDGDPGYIATGHTLSSALTVAGVPQYAYRWVWGGSARPFPEHLALHGQTFADQSDDALAVPDAFATWLPGTSFAPGDHDGCNCSTERLVEDPFENMDPAEARRVRAAQKMRGPDGRFIRNAAGVSAAE